MLILPRGVLGLSARARAPSKGTCIGESQDNPFAQGLLQGDMLRRVSGPSVRAKASTKGTFCGESQEHPLARGHLPKGHAAGSLRTIRSCEGTFQCDMEQGVPELSTRARVPSKGKCCGESEDHPSVPRRLPREHAAGSLRTIRSRQGTLQRDMLRGV